MKAWVQAISPRRSMRSRLTLIGTAVLFLGLILGAVAFDRILDSRLRANLDQGLVAQAVDRSAAIDAGVDPDSQLDTVQRETAVAVFDSAGTVVANRGFDNPGQVANVRSEAPITLSIDLFEAHEQEVERYDLRVVAAQGADLRVVVATEVESVTDSLGVARRLLAVGVPLLALVGGGLFWVLVGRSLQPVERLRADAQTIADTGVRGRVHQPASEDEIGRLAETLNDMLARLDQSSATLRRFVSDSSHEIRSPIANIRARVETVDASGWNDARADVVSEVERLEAIVDDLTYLAQSDEGQVRHQPVRVEVDDVLFAEAARLQQRGRVLVDAGGVAPFVVNADADQFRRLVRNLVDNAERHAAANVRLAVEAVESGFVAIEVDDDGSGVPEQDRQRIFERFARLDASRDRATGGTGLGLAIVSDIVDRHGGVIAVSASALGGARFRVTLPVVQPTEY